MQDLQSTCVVRPSPFRSIGVTSSVAVYQNALLLLDILFAALTGSMRRKRRRRRKSRGNLMLCLRVDSGYLEVSGTSCIGRYGGTFLL